LSGTGELTAQTFLDKIAQTLPVIDRGAYRHHVAGKMITELSRSDRLTDSMSFAIRRLEREGSIQLGDRDDAERVVLFDGSTISHVRKGASR
jgi:hypothetical protein